MSEWIPVKWHEITEEEREREGYPKEWVIYFDSEMPADGEEILITVKYTYPITSEVVYSVMKDECFYDDGFGLDSGYDWVEDIVAWMPLPEPYKAESEVQDADSN